MSKNKTESKPEKHEYHSISDNEENGDELDAFSKPLDLGPSLLDEVFKELDHPGGDHNIGKKLALKKYYQFLQWKSNGSNIPPSTSCVIF